MDAKDQELFDQAKQIVFLTGAGVQRLREFRIFAVPMAYIHRITMPNII